MNFMHFTKHSSILHINSNILNMILTFITLSTFSMTSFFLFQEKSSLPSSDYTSENMFASRPKNSLPPLSTEKRSKRKKNGALPPINKHETWSWLLLENKDLHLHRTRCETESFRHNQTGSAVHANEHARENRSGAADEHVTICDMSIILIHLELCTWRSYIDMIIDVMTIWNTFSISIGSVKLSPLREPDKYILYIVFFLFQHESCETHWLNSIFTGRCLASNFWFNLQYQACSINTMRNMLFKTTLIFNVKTYVVFLIYIFLVYTWVCIFLFLLFYENFVNF